jgi:hypothetical protein
MSEEKGYSGWTNYETWNLKLWLDNERPWYHEMTEHANSCVEDSVDQDGEIQKDCAVSDMREYLEGWVDENTPTLHWPEDMGGGKITASMFNDILGAGLSEINYHEIAESYVDEAIEQNKE